MSFCLPLKAVIFDMDGLLIDSEPYWEQGEKHIFGELGLDLTLAEKLPDTLGLRIDQVVELWYQAAPWQGTSKNEVAQHIINYVVQLVKENRPLLPGVEYALNLCRGHGLKIGLASASPYGMLEQVLELFNIRHYFDAIVSAADLPYSKPHPEVYLQAASQLGINPIQCITLEDSFNGMIATKAARMRSIVVPAAHHFDDPRWSLADIKLNSLNKLTIENIT
ncbi:hexitol phosphatase HxpB [Xenorhabdus nematophila]|uniref:hexitol phosphatase HxpB n=1 Tax=Xenorhabdus nematophila TaxID=628 RepID=UPI000543EDAB|nr:hexitol phosphatase HxpB [Xenorhabdus nematophila]CEE94006.1 putative enzyme, with a phosphatase-like domain [Xenorhabdus nematophila str. Anatoliense]CEF33759.1 putative enzyme, with a phosphatase-like domain [Xenorhabdus nematophila str. Websteri]AYA40467.1 hexitol phosphatase HxpB [Xenorhabdus nematophila]KHD28497.1 2-deoxyglucose-6-phosphatase [Xenorhabdus nematophila]MBA0019201.1 hexitol phosphatase HxpB [Xenorhabdus nematophila]